MLLVPLVLEGLAGQKEHFMSAEKPTLTQQQLDLVIGTMGALGADWLLHEGSINPTPFQLNRWRNIAVAVALDDPGAGMNDVSEESIKEVVRIGTSLAATIGAEVARGF